MTLFLQQPSIEPQRPEEGAAEQWSPRRPDIFRRRSGSGGRRHSEVNSYCGETGHGEGVSRRLDSPQQLASTPREMLQIRTWSVFLLLINTRSLRVFFFCKKCWYYSHSTDSALVQVEAGNRALKSVFGSKLAAKGKSLAELLQPHSTGKHDRILNC